MNELYILFPVPNHDHFQVLPEQQQDRIIGQGEVMTRLQELVDEKFTEVNHN